MQSDLESIGSRLRQARLANHMSQLQLAEAAGISASFLSNIENGRQSMNLRSLIALTDALGISSDWLIKGDEKSVSPVTEMIENELSSCTQKERELILQLTLLMKQSIASIANTADK